MMQNKWFMEDKRLEIYVAATATPLSCYKYKRNNAMLK